MWHERGSGQLRASWWSNHHGEDGQCCVGNWQERSLGFHWDPTRSCAFRISRHRPQGAFGVSGRLIETKKKDIMRDRFQHYSEIISATETLGLLTPLKQTPLHHCCWIVIPTASVLVIRASNQIQHHCLTRHVGLLNETIRNSSVAALGPKSRESKFVRNPTWNGLSTSLRNPTFLVTGSKKSIHTTNTCLKPIDPWNMLLDKKHGVFSIFSSTFQQQRLYC